MFRVFYLDAAEVYLDVAMHVVSICFKCSDVSYVCCKCFICTFAYVFAMDLKCSHVFQKYIASVSAVSDVRCKCFHLDIVKVG
jgi:hypothetical protein